MTSRVSFPKLVIENLRRHIAIVLITVLTFIIHLITFFLNVQNIISAVYIEDYASSFYPVEAANKEHIIEEIFDLCSPNLTNGIVALIIGVVLAFDFFRYMHSKRETDFYESLPIKKQSRFFTILCSCVGLFLILCTATVGIELAIVYGMGYGSSAIFKHMCWNLLCMIAAFLVGWASTALVMILTGHPIVAILGLGAFSVYVPLIIGYLFPVYAGTFFETYVMEDLNSNYYYFSPATLVYKMTYNWTKWNIGEHWTYLLGSFIFALIVGIISYLLFLRRPSETAGRAMAFEKTNFIIRFLLVIPLSLYAGALLYTLSSLASYAWLIFGVVFAAFLLHGIIESIFQFDIKALLRKKRQLLISVVVSLAIVFVFWFDLFGFDNYMPKESDLKAVMIDTYLFNNYGQNENISWRDGLTGEYIDDALKVIKDIRDTSTNDSDDEDYHYQNTFNVTYRLKNGTERKRAYSYYGNTYPESLDKLYATEEFKNDYCILYQLDKADIKSVNISNGPESRALTLEGAELVKFYNIYLDEYTKLSLSKQLQTQAVYELIITHTAKNKDYSIRDNYPIYETFTNTIAYIKDLGIDTFNDSSAIKLQNLEIYNKDYESQKYVNDTVQLEELRKHMILSNFMFEQYEDNYVYCDLRYELDGETRYTSVFIPTEELKSILK